MTNSNSELKLLHSEEICTKICVFLFGEYQAIDAEIWRFLYSCIIHTSLSHAPAFLDCTDHVF